LVTKIDLMDYKLCTDIGQTPSIGPGAQNNLDAMTFSE